MNGVIIDLSSGSENDSPSPKRAKLNPVDHIELLTDDEQIEHIDTPAPKGERDSNPVLSNPTKENVELKNNIVESTVIDDKSSDNNASPVAINDCNDKESLLVVLREEALGLEEDLDQPENETRTTSPNDFNEEVTEPIKTKQIIFLPNELEEFLNLCKKNLSTATHIERKMRTLRSTAVHASDYIKTDEFLAELQILRTEVDAWPDKSAKPFSKLYALLLSKENANKQSNEEMQDVKLALQLDDLYDKLERVKIRIHELETREVDFEAEENSSYIQFHKYSEKAAQILRAIAKLEQRSPYAGLAYFSRLDFARSKINAFNLALNKKYRNREEHTFPNFYDVNKCLRRCAKKNNIQLSETELKDEIEVCFKELGKLLKKRRQRDLESVHNEYLTGFKDPAAEDANLDSQLKDNRKLGRDRLEEVLKKYTGMQETGVEPVLSEDSDDSRHVDSDERDDSTDAGE